MKYVVLSKRRRASVEPVGLGENSVPQTSVYCNLNSDVILYRHEKEEDQKGSNEQDVNILREEWQRAALKTRLAPVCRHDSLESSFHSPATEALVLGRPENLRSLCCGQTKPVPDDVELSACADSRLLFEVVNIFHQTSQQADPIPTSARTQANTARHGTTRHGMTLNQQCLLSQRPFVLLFFFHVPHIKGKKLTLWWRQIGDIMRHLPKASPPR
ncbi:hypothetical protein PoB_000045200 [Plakobranchus ocellatus]|uniref:Uncharacterized protein n=1 Tax=Plakobranchus ocellatus TaxID=259542 RepID=A0AAV3XV05_9GAST|nr:hypothetical protein PoB_000045200 [Plakobranchus ocellatus]